MKTFAILKDTLPLSLPRLSNQIVCVCDTLPLSLPRLSNQIVCVCDTLPLSLPRLSNQIVCVCAFLSNFKPVLVPPEAQVNKSDELDVDAYFEGWSGDSEHDRDE